jgi:hypothetical protein
MKSDKYVFLLSEEVFDYTFLLFEFLARFLLRFIFVKSISIEVNFTDDGDFFSTEEIFNNGKNVPFDKVRICA